ncbi:sigma-70 family RNA polymerase sigma factor [Rubrivirga sp. S365]|uniref:Sigma-70 family RNA polymerase sigma factor n=1 Tax=Rubrivirga litoralis TaxID=3075598 RepID=A0ABU3BQ25_9BACT|nr:MULTISPECIES: sigma-70 family RNA polymerase sigma factor [unclassified Rubrivirga]MDT0631375.1 sigma-70 family RNA polymerase sigma factor [Rubrivirga sp. F394]MDT7855966.1 sigma-70 family RNA polymerase sigma factor [Rubrivirga sp. S365]
MAPPDLQDAVDRYLDDPTPRRREAAVLAALPLVHSIVGKVRAPDHPLTSPEDLEGSAIEGLLQALDSYDPNRGVLFATHAYRRVRGSVVDALRAIDVLSSAKRKRMGEVRRATSSLRQTLGHEPSDDDVAAAVGLSVRDYHALLSEAQLRYTLSLDRPASADPEAAALGDLVADADAGAGFEAVEQGSLQAQLAREIPRLPERQRTILALYYHEDLTLREVGEVLGVSDARISQILGKILLTLRGRLMAERAAA